ncbi:MAG: cell wall metabolism sensor histidine kinase WalK [Clostridiales bacterium]|nr:cell wall metabolism sensor histidine kinase WalK [Clostridiales bacterium]
MIYIVLVFIVMIVSGVFLLLQITSNEIAKAENQLMEFTGTIIGEIVSGNSTPEEFQQGFDILKQPQGIQGYIIDARGENQTLAPRESLSMHFSDSAIISALVGQIGVNPKKKDRDNNNTMKEWITCATPVVEGNEIRYVVYARLDASAMNDNISEITITIFFMIIIALALTAIFGLFLANTLTGPIIALTKQAKNMAMGNLNQEIPVYSDDEIGQLTQTINDMAKELSLTISTMASEKNKIKVVLDNMTDGVLAYDNQRNLVHANNAAADLLNLGDLEMIPSTEVLSHLGFDDGDRNKESTIAAGDKFISSSITPYLNTNGQVEGIVVVIQDVTKLTKLDNMRKEFVANVSHELRTPLTTVKTYTETLLDGALEDEAVAVNFLKVVDSEASRMSVLVQDLLELSRLDNSQLNLDLEVIDLDALIVKSIRQNLVLAEKKRQSIKYSPPDEECFICADSGRINQVLTNIISNSVKYSLEESEIRVDIEVSEDYFSVYIKDNGIGIPKEDLRRVFERFYRVDKARSRAMGGTGLGLAIAKEIMEAHGFKISINSDLGKGTTMILRFDRYEALA